MSDQKKTPTPPKRTPEEAMREFEYACRVWFACMPSFWQRNAALKIAEDMARKTSFAPNRPPRSA